MTERHSIGQLQVIRGIDDDAYRDLLKLGAMLPEFDGRNDHANVEQEIRGMKPSQVIDRIAQAVQETPEIFNAPKGVEDLISSVRSRIQVIQ